MEQYLKLLKHVRDNGVFKQDRTETGTYSCFGGQLRFNLSEGFPAVTTKRLFFKGVVVELLWFLMGGTTLEYLHEHGVRIWDQWSIGGHLGPIYGAQWRSWPTHVLKTNEDGDIVDAVREIDQLAGVISQIKRNPDSRRLVVSAWNVGELPQMNLVPCHLMFQFYVVEGKLSCHMYQRSADLFLGVPFNIASYSLLTHMVARECGLDVGDYIHSFGDVHIYSNHLEQVEEQLSREPKPLPELWLNPDKNRVDDFELEDIKLVGYESWPTIKAPIAV